MPSHFTHLIFAEESLAGALGDEATPILRTHGNLLRFAAQGPDIFYHNQRTMPTGLRFGVALHKHGYGTMVGELVREALRLGMGPATELGAYILGFATHAILDRHTHPYIIHFAGWDEAASRATTACTTPTRSSSASSTCWCSGSAAASSRRSSTSSPWSALRPRPALPRAEGAREGAARHLPDRSRRKSLDRARIENAYHDTVFFYKLTNHLNAELPRMAWKKDRKDGFRQRRLGLLHPREVPPGVDFLNRRAAAVVPPLRRHRGLARRASSTCTTEALDESVRVTRLAARRALSGRAPIEDVAAAVGDLSLDTGREPCTPRFSDPFPLREILDEEYRRLDAERIAPRRACRIVTPAACRS